MTGQSETKHTRGELRAVKAPHGPVDIFDDFDHDICTIYGSRAKADAARIVLTWNCHDELVAALRRADEFIRNGIALGFIRMPDASTPDPAHETPGIIAAALSRATSPTP